MTNPAPQFDQAFAAVLDLYAVPPASANFTDRIVAAPSGAQQSLPGSQASRRDRRGPWRRRALAGGLALVLGTTAVAATLLERAGIRLPEVVAMLSPGPGLKSPQPQAAKRQAVVTARAATPVPQSGVSGGDASESTSLEPSSVPLRGALIRERLAELPPSERRVVVRRAIRNAIVVRAAERRLMVDRGIDPSVVASEMPDRPRLIRRPVLRAAVIERVAEVRAERALAPDGLMARTSRQSALADVRAPGAAASIDPPGAGKPSIGASLPDARPERLRQLGEFRRMQALRQQLRRQRRR